MFRFITLRIISSLAVLLTIITITFFLMHSIPGGPFTAEKAVPAPIKKNIEIRYHLNDPLGRQYSDYLLNIAHGDLGPSFRYEARTVNQIIAESFPVSAELGLIAVAIALVLGLPAGIIAAVNHNRWPDYGAMFLASLGMSVPSFILAAIFIYFLAIKLKILPAALWGSWEFAIMPALALAALPTAFIARLMRASLLEVLAQNYIKVARAKGLPNYLILFRHALKNAILPVVTYVGPLMAGILTGSFVVETIFAIPGLGRYFVSSIYNRDYTVILGVTIFYSALLIFFNLLVDITYSLLDPRIKLGSEERE